MGNGIPDEILQAIITDAANAAATGDSRVELVKTTAVTWTDGSLGCPKPGMMYTQALVDGYQVIVRVDDEQFDYRVGRNGAFIICEDDG